MIAGNLGQGAYVPPELVAKLEPTWGPNNLTVFFSSAMPDSPFNNLYGNWVTVCVKHNYAKAWGDYYLALRVSAGMVWCRDCIWEKA